MGLDQSIFTTSKAIARAIHDGKTLGNKWSGACFSPVTLEGDPEWTRLDDYAHSRLNQLGIPNAGSITIGGLNLTIFGISIADSPAFVPDDVRKETLSVIEQLGYEGCAATLDGQTTYQLGLFQDFRPLHNWMCGHCPVDIPNDTHFPLNGAALKVLLTDCQLVLSSFEVSHDGGVEAAKFVFAVDDEDVDGFFETQLRELADFLALVLSFPASTQALFYYNPWW